MHSVYLKVLCHRNLIYKPHHVTTALRQILPGRVQGQCSLAELMTFSNQLQAHVE